MIKAPNSIPIHTGKKILFLSGSIEMGAAEHWQERVAKLIDENHWLVLNPRRDDWDNTWQQTLKDERFVEQVQWELACMEIADNILCYFSPETKAPITLLEFGLHAASGKMLVVCPDGFYRKGNVDVTCRRYNIPQFLSLESAIHALNAGNP